MTNNRSFGTATEKTCLKCGGTGKVKHNGKGGVKEIPCPICRGSGKSAGVVTK